MRSNPARLVASLVFPLAVLGMTSAPAWADNPPPASSPTATTSSLTAPTSLTMSLPGTTRTLPTGSWTYAPRVNLSFQVQASGTPVIPEVEIEPAAVPFTGQPNILGNAVTASGTVTVPAGTLVSGKTYHWQARVADNQGHTSGWTTFSPPGTAFDIGIDRVAPSRPVIHSPTDPLESRWYNSPKVFLTWKSSDSLSGIAGYSYVVERQARVIPPGSTNAHTSLTLSNLANGVWFLAIRAEDRAGNWSPTATYRIQIDRTTPQLVWLSQPRFTFNPYRGPTTVRFRFSKAVSASFALYRVGSKTPVATYHFAHLAANQPASITWSGKGRNGHFAAKGYYFFAAQAVDHADNRGLWHVAGISVDPVQAVTAPGGVPLYPGGGKIIIVSLSRQELFAYDGTKLVVQTYVTTGNPSLPTPLGHFTILAKYHPFEFISPWPVGSPYYYPPSPTNFAMLFQSQGYFIHDAPWRSAYGPGTNQPGQPGTNYGGTHGCVNVPYNPMLTLFDWTPLGTPVDVVP